MIDTHLHILPGVDDGPETMQESLELARVLVQEGIHTAIATPHYNDEFLPRSATEIQERVNHLQQELDRHNIPLRLFAGHEALIKPGLVEDIQAGRLATLNGSRYLLLELWSSAWLPETERVIFELRAFGIVPIIAHPERYRAIQQDLHRLTALLQQGVLAQMMASSLIGMQGNTARRTAESLLTGVVQSLQRARQLLGQARVYQMVESLPAAIVNNEEHTLALSRNDTYFGRGER